MYTVPMKSWPEFWEKEKTNRRQRRWKERTKTKKGAREIQEPVQFSFIKQTGPCVRKRYLSVELSSAVEAKVAADTMGVGRGATTTRLGGEESGAALLAGKADVGRRARVA